MKKIVFAFLIAASTLSLIGCHEHTWTEATCTEAKTCSVCGETEGEALGHTWIEATCTEAKTCSVCGETEGEPIEHTWEEATCTTAKVCSVCGTKEGKALGHQEGEWTVITPATENSVGEMECRCAVCGEVIDTKEVYYYDITDEEAESYDMALNIFNSVKEENVYGDTAVMYGAKICSTPLGKRVSVALSIDGKTGTSYYYFWQTYADKTKISNYMGKDFYIEGRDSHATFETLDENVLKYYEKFIYESDLTKVTVKTDYIYDALE